MKFLADMGISPGMVAMLRAEGHDAVHLQEQGLERLTDPVILAKAAQEERILLTGYSLNTDKENLVEAAHIHQHALSGNDDPRNGLALTPDAHWMFDRGLWTAECRGDSFIVLVAAGRFRESSPHGRSLGAYHGKPLCFPEDSTFRPDPRHFQWHRRHRFIGS